MDLLKEHIADIENCAKDTRTQMKRKTAWKAIVANFNSKAEVIKRDEVQLSTLWRKIKREAKKDDSRFRRESARTGGGPAPEPTSATTEEVKALLPAVFKPVANVFDDDSTMDAAADASMEETDASFTSSVTPDARGDTCSSSEPVLAPSTSTQKQTQPEGKQRKSATSGEKITDFASEYHKLLQSCLQEEHAMKMASLRRDAELREWEHEARMDVLRTMKSRLESADARDVGQELQQVASVLHYM